MAPLISLVTFSVLTLCLIVRGQQLTIVTPPNSSVVQCANLTIQWSGGVPPFFLAMNAVLDSPTNAWDSYDSVAGSPFVWDVRMIAGTEITLFVQDKNSTSAETPVIAVQNSTNSSCLDGDGPPPDVPTQTRTKLDPTSSQTGTSGSSPSATESSNPASTSRASTSKVAIIVGAVIGCLILIALLILLMSMQKRRQRRQHTSSKEALVRTFGSDKADLDGFTEEHTEAMAIPDPYVYESVPHAPSTSTPIDAEELSQNPSSSRSDPAGHATISRPTPTTRKGEIHLPNYGTSPQETSPGGTSSGPPPIPEGDIARLAAHMMAMMSAAGLNEQAWTQGTPGARAGNLDDYEVNRVPPPLYKDVAGRNMGR